MSEQDDKKQFEGWCIIEQMGHKRMAGYVSEQVVGGHSFIRIDIPGPDGAFVATQFITGQTIYAMTPCSEVLARRVAISCQPQPVTEWDLKPSLRALPPSDDDDSVDFDDVVDDDDEQL